MITVTAAEEEPAADQVLLVAAAEPRGCDHGHVGAAELMKEILLNDGIGSFIRQGLAGNLGEYPPLYAATIGFWWRLVGTAPEMWEVRSIGLIFILLTALCGAWLGQKLRCPPHFIFFLIF